MKSYIFIINPNSNNGKTHIVEEKIRKIMDKTKHRYEIHISEKEESRSLIKRKIREGFEYVIACGGDGTLNNVGYAVAEAGGILGILPLGTGNDFSRILGFNRDIESNMERILNPRVKKVDYGMANDLFFINTCSIGFDALVICEMQKIRKHIKGKISYYLGLIKSFFKYKPLKITLAHGKEDQSTFLFAITNGAYYGGGFKIAPKAQYDDGYLELIMLNNASKLKVLKIFPSLFTGKHIYNKDVIYERVKEYSIYTRENILLNLDGEIFEIKKDIKIDFSIVNEGLSIIY